MTELAALQEELNKVKTTLHEEHDKYLTKVSAVIDKWFVKPLNAVCSRVYMQQGWRCDNDTVQFDVGFYNETEQRVDFGSDVSFYFENNKLHANYGTCGMYTKEDVYQIKRVKLLNYIWDNVNEIEQELLSIVSVSSVLLNEYRNTIYSIEAHIRNLEEQARQAEKQEVEKHIVVGKELAYNQDCNLHRSYRLFDSVCTITHVTPKTVTIRGLYNNPRRVRKESLVDHIYKNYIKICENND